MDAIMIVPKTVDRSMAIGRKVAKLDTTKKISILNKYRREVGKVNAVVNEQPNNVINDVKAPVESKSKRIKNNFNMEYYDYDRTNHNVRRETARKLHVNTVVVDNTRSTHNEILRNGDFTYIAGEKKVEMPQISQEAVINEPINNDFVNNSVINNQFSGQEASFSRVSRLSSNDLYNSEPANEEIAHPVDMDQYNSLVHSGENPDTIDMDIAHKTNQVNQIKQENEEKRRLIEEAKLRIKQLEKVQELEEVKEELLSQTTEFNSLTQELAALTAHEEELRRGMRR